jgi:hypothetical protein
VAPVTAALIRVILVALATCAVVLGARALRDDPRCSQVTKEAGTLPAGRLSTIPRAAIHACGDPSDRGVIALVLRARHRDDAADDLARRMTVAAPDDYTGWLLVWRFTGSRSALAVAHRLNPRGTPAS